MYVCRRGHVAIRAVTGIRCSFMVREREGEDSEVREGEGSEQRR